MRKKRECYIPQELVKNLTQTSISVYANTGEILTLDPEGSFTSNRFYYIVENDNPDYRCIKILAQGIGRDGITISHLVLYSRQNVRVYPTVGY